MQKRHKDRRQYFEEQSITTEKYVIPFIEKSIPITKNTLVLEIGCGEGGNLFPFIEKGCIVTGVDMNANKIKNANLFYANYTETNKPTFVLTDIYDWETDQKFDVIMLRDVLEHIHNQEKFLKFVKKFLKPDGKLFLGFPPWQNPYGGHQQMFDSTIARLPFIHLLPTKLYTWILRKLKESEKEIEAIVEIKETRITIERFYKIIRDQNYTISNSTFYFINPNYEIKFGLKPRKQLRIITKIPWLRNLLITTCYVTLETRTKQTKNE
ncbi:MAG: methyltransferase domain-containing protein [Salinivirgaceae bacterium]|nr:methyltransferase domain-containing protein [Salinivirgaceae bacterium]